MATYDLPFPTTPHIRGRFIATAGFIGAAIRWTTNSLFQHFEFGTPKGTWIGAHVDDGVQDREGDYCTCTLEYVYDIPCTQEQMDAFYKWAYQQIGTKYNTLDIFGILLKKRKWTTPGHVICTQFGTDGLLFIFPTSRVLNVQRDERYTALITPEELHLSPIFAGHRVRAIGEPK